MEYTLEDHLSINCRSGEPNHIGEVFREMTRFLEQEGEPYVFVGPLALDLYIAPFRYTDEIRIVGTPALAAQIGERIAALSGNKRYEQVKVLFDCADCPENKHALRNRVKAKLFDTVAPFASPLSLAWLFLEGDLGQDQVDVGQLIYDRAASAEELQALLESHQAQHALDRLAEVQTSIDRGGYSGSYDDSVKARLARLKR